MGPANLLYVVPTGYKATMTGLPYDDLDGWRGPYPADVFANQFAKMAEDWAAGLADLEAAAAMAPEANRAEAMVVKRFARATHFHFASAANQARFAVLRDRLLDGACLPKDRSALAMAAVKVARDEARLAAELFTLAGPTLASV